MRSAQGIVMPPLRTLVRTVGSQVIVIPKSLKYEWPKTPENNYVDSFVDAKLQKLRILPSELCSDDAYLRRVYLDVIGQLPNREEYDRFMASNDAKKREKLVDELLSRKEFVELWVMKFAELLQIRTTDNQVVSYKAALLYYNWLAEKMAANVPMNKIVQELLGANGGTFKNPAANYYQVTTDQLPLAENTAQVFMGMRIQCAQCHNHPFDRWTMSDYRGFVSFFTQVGRKQGEDPRERIVFNSGGGDARHPVDNRVIPPKFLGEEQPDCTGKQCGPDGAGGSCGACSSNEHCTAGKCIPTDPTCTPACTAKQNCRNGACVCKPDPNCCELDSHTCACRKPRPPPPGACP